MSVRDLMAGRGGFLCQRLPLWLPLVTSLLIYSSLCSTVDDIPELPPCCKQTTSSHDMICECYPEDRVNPVTSISIHKGSIPTSVQSIKIAGPINVTFHKHAFYEMLQLGTLEVDLRRKGTLSVAEEGLALQSENSLRLLKFANAKNVVFASSGLAGSWNYDTAIEVNNVERFRIQQNGISFRSIGSGPGPSLSMNHVNTALEMAHYALNASISSLTMLNVKILTCSKENFGGEISRMEMKSGSITVVDNNCIKASNMERLSIESCDIEQVKYQGISGHISDVYIKDTVVKDIEPYGFMPQVTTLRIKDSHILDLKSNGLNVTAKKSIEFDNINITTLRENALVSLTGAEISFKDFTITNAQPGSLAFSKELMIRLSGYMNVDVPDPPICPTKKWIRLLVGKLDDEPLAAADKTLQFKLQRAWHCPDTTATMAPTETTPVTEIPRKTTTGDADHEIGSSSTPATDTSTPSEGTPKGDENSTVTTPSREPKSTGTPSTTGIIIGFLFVVVVVIAAVLYCKRRYWHNGVYRVPQADPNPAAADNS